MAADRTLLTDEQLRTTIIEFLSAVNAHDVERILPFFTDDVVWEGSGFPAPVAGRVAVVEALREWFSAFPDLHFPLEDVEVFRSVDGDHALAFWTSVMTMEGPFAGFAPTGRHAKGKGVCRYEFVDGRIARHSIVYDQMQVSQQLGLLPAEGSTGYRLFTGVQRLGTRLSRVRAR
jgi:steroid delta-isomerase-like uncharacterized protein